LPDDINVPAHGDEAAQQAAERDDETDDDRHVMAPESTQPPFSKALRPCASLI
jgi:hypothetical protein